MNRHRSSLLFSAVATLALHLFATPARAQQPPDPRVADLVHAGRLRAGLAQGALLALKDPVTGEWRGVAVDLARELAVCIGVPLQLVEYANFPKILEGAGASAWDVTFFAIDPDPAKVVEDRFTAALQAIAVPKGQAGRLAYVSEFIEEAKASGFVQRAIERAGLRGVQVAPPPPQARRQRSGPSSTGSSWPRTPTISRRLASRSRIPPAFCGSPAGHPSGGARQL